MALPAMLKSLPVLGRGVLPDAEPEPAALDNMLRVALLISLLLLATLAAAGSIIQVRGAVRATGEVDVETKVKKVAHPTGGVIEAVAVRDGDRVRKGQVLMRLDSAVSAASASITGKSVDQLRAQRARLVAERDGTADVAFPADLTGTSAVAAVAEERRMFRLRLDNRRGQDLQLAERVRQLEQQIGGYRVQVAAAQRQQELVGPELEGLRGLYRRQLVPINRLNALERTAVELEAQEGSLESQIATARAQIAEMRERRLQLVEEARSSSGTELAAVDQRLAEGQVRAVTSADAEGRSVIRAPADGVVDQLAYTTVGGVVPAGETIMRIVPIKGAMTVEARIRPDDIDQIAAGRAVYLRFSAFSAPTTPTIRGILSRVSPDRAIDAKTGVPYYSATVTIPPREAPRLGDLVLVPGMPVEAMIQTARRSLLSYITKPFQDQLARAFRES